MSHSPKTVLGRILVWRARHLSQQQFVLILSVLVGFITGLVAVVLKNTTHLIQQLISSNNFSQYFNPYYFVFPIIGIGITVLIRRLIKGKIGQGIPSTLFSILRKNGILPTHRMYSSIITSIFTVGFGGSVGLEAPTVSSGAAIGSNLGRVMHIDYKSRILLMSCAAAGALASIFNAPIAAIIFTIEIFSLDLTLTSLIPLLLSSAAGVVTSIFIQGNDYIFHLDKVSPFVVEELPLYILLGVITAFISLYFNKIYFRVSAYFNKISTQFRRTLIGGGLLGLMIFLFPPLYGEGYETINILLNGNVTQIANFGILESLDSKEYFIILMLLCLMMFKIIATSFTIGAGGIGGIFAPALFTGATLGYLYSICINDAGIASIAVSNYTLVGMTGLMAGTLHAPLTAIFMIAEISGGYELFIPLMLVSAISFLVSRHFMPHSIYTTQLAQKGDLLTHNKDKAVLSVLTVDKLVEKNFAEIHPKMSLRQLIQVVKTSKRNIFPVVSSSRKLVGILTLDDIRDIMFDESLYDIIAVAELMTQPPDTIQKDEDMKSVIQKFRSTGAWNLPVVDEETYVGFISKSKLFSAYRRKLIEFSV
ncbi:chloride channel protein [Gracilimonas mengyeensis]|uniref:Chloride channel protein, CIC family n=1 Tax=Gracilimonas mengyeensis TaxID=1302730 RepID=A0A521D4H5_9BACT|nr:chloride channel protein [Gracilimonas mengyeensis]SMO66522.1 chloride channel protein, CIC family [Gracilimonas mengyeensis]